MSMRRSTHVVALDGRLDSDSAPDFEKRILDFLEEQPKFVVLDLEKLDYISSAGLRVVTRAFKITKEYGGIISMANVQPSIKKVFEIVKLVPVNQIFASVEELDAYLDQMQSGEQPD